MRGSVMTIAKDKDDFSIKKKPRNLAAHQNPINNKLDTINYVHCKFLLRPHTTMACGFLVCYIVCYWGGI